MLEKFRLLNLPQLPIILVLELMDPNEQIRIIMTSRRLGSHMRIARPLISGIQVYIESKFCSITFAKPNSEQCNLVFVKTPGKSLKSVKTEKLDLAKIPFSVIEGSIICQSSTTLKDFIEVSKHFRSRFKSLFTHCVFNFEKLDNIELLSSLYLTLKDKCTKVSILGGDLKHAHLNMLMRMSNPTMSIQVTSRMFLSYQNEKTFQFRSIDYAETYFITISDLLHLPDNSEVYLGQTGLNTHQFIYFLSCWVESEKDMMKKIQLKLYGNRILKKFIIESGLTASYFDDSEQAKLMMMTKNVDKRKRPIGIVTLKEDLITLETYGVDDGYSSQIMFMNALLKVRQYPLVDANGIYMLAEYRQSEEQYLHEKRKAEEKVQLENDLLKTLEKKTKIIQDINNNEK